MPYHVEHHVMPAVPFHKLAGLHRHTARHATVIEPGFLGFNRKTLASFTNDRHQPTGSRR